MAAAIPIVADIIFSAVVAKVAQKVVTDVATQLGADEGTASMLGSIAGIAGGAYAYGGASKAMGLGEAAGATTRAIDTGMEGVRLSGDAPTLSLTQPTTDAASSLYTVDPSLAPAAQTGGMLTEGTGAGAQVSGMLEQAPQQAAAMPVTERLAGAADVAAKDPWYKTMWESKRTGDVLVGTAGGAATSILGASAKADAIEAERAQEVADRRKLTGPKRTFNRATAMGANPYLNKQSLAVRGAG